MTRFGVYDKLKDYLLARNRAQHRSSALELTGAGGRQLPAWQMALAGCVAGGVGGIAGNPADIVLVRMIADRVKPPDQQLGYRNACVGVCAAV